MGMELLLLTHPCSMPDYSWRTKATEQSTSQPVRVTGHCLCSSVLMSLTSFWPQHNSYRSGQGVVWHGFSMASRGFVRHVFSFTRGGSREALVREGFAFQSE